MLGSAVNGYQWLWPYAGAGADIDEASTSVCPEVGQCCLHHLHIAEEVGFEEGTCNLDGRRFENREEPLAGVVDDTIEIAKVFYRLSECSLNRHQVANVKR